MEAPLDNALCLIFQPNFCIGPQILRLWGNFKFYVDIQKNEDVVEEKNLQISSAIKMDELISDRDKAVNNSKQDILCGLYPHLAVLPFPGLKHI